MKIHLFQFEIFYQIIFIQPKFFIKYNKILLANQQTTQYQLISEFSTYLSPVF